MKYIPPVALLCSVAINLLQGAYYPAPLENDFVIGDFKFQSGEEYQGLHS